MDTLFQNTYGKLYIKKRSSSEWLALLIIVFPFVLSFLTDLLGLPDFIRLIIDAILVYFFIVFFINKTIIIKRSIKPLLTLIIIFFVYTLVVYFVNFQSPFYYFWGLRNNFRFYIAFFTFVLYIKENFANSILKLIDVLFWFHIVIALVQFFFLDVKEDFLGGLFGISNIANGYTLIFFAIVISKSLLLTFNGVESILHCILKCVASFIIAAMSEIKFYFFAFAFILLLASLMSRFTWKKLLLMIVCGLAIILGALLLSNLFGSGDFLRLERLWEMATKENYSSQNDINRLSAIFTLSKNYVTEPSQQLFGLGLGNCDVSDVAIFNSTFYQTHSFLHYTWFTSAMLFLETGVIGLLIYTSFFGLCFIRAFRQIRANSGNRLFCQMAIIMSIFCVIIMFYNSSLRIESGYMAYFVLALPFLARDKHKEAPGEIAVS